MYYYFDVDSRRFAHSSTVPLLAEPCLEIVDSTIYDDVLSLTYETVNGVNKIVRDESYAKQLKFENEKSTAIKTAKDMISLLELTVDFGEADERTAAQEKVLEWRRYQYDVTKATELPLPAQPQPLSAKE